MDRGKAIDVITDAMQSAFDEYVDEVEEDVQDIISDLETIIENEDWDGLESILDDLRILGNKVY